MKTLDDILGLLAKGEPQWTSGWTASWQDFEERFTLHDSVWVGIFFCLKEANEAVMIVEWDAYWLPEPLRSQCMDGSTPPNFGNPWLIVRLSDVRSVQFSGYEEEISHRSISQMEFSTHDGVKVLEVVDMIGATARLEFTGNTEFLAIRPEDGASLRLEDAELRQGQVTSVKERPWWRFW